jgi:hypothetical protein
VFGVARTRVIWKDAGVAEEIVLLLGLHQTAYLRPNLREREPEGYFADNLVSRIAPGGSERWRAA